MQVSPSSDLEAPYAGADVTERARKLVADAVSDIMGFWNFKPSMGRVWSCLYLSPRPLTSAEIVAATGLSVGSVSMTLTDLQSWGVVLGAGRSGGRRCFEAETDVIRMVIRVFRERELVLVAETIDKLDAAVRLLDQYGRSSVPTEMLEGRFVVTRARRLLALAKGGHQMLDRFTRVGRLDISSIRNKLSRRRQ
jgi:DNA-binding transcriptional regulator GbsR (MarR family)